MVRQHIVAKLISVTTRVRAAMAEHVHDEPVRLRAFAQELRELARVSVLPGYAERLLHAAEELEWHATELEAQLKK